MCREWFIFFIYFRIYYIEWNFRGIRYFEDFRLGDYFYFVGNSFYGYGFYVVSFGK